MTRTVVLKVTVQLENVPEEVPDADLELGQLVADIQGAIDVGLEGAPDEVQKSVGEVKVEVAHVPE